MRNRSPGLTSGLLTLLTIGALAASCNGEEFSSAGGGGAASTGGDDSDRAGAPASGGAAGDAGDGSLAGESSGEGGGGGEGGQVDLPERCDPSAAPRCATRRAVATCDASGAWRLTECESDAMACSPAKCEDGACVQSTLVPAEVEGDCKQWQCASGDAIEIPLLDDLPATQGVCDVASCTEAGPQLTDDDAKCPINQRCSEGACECRSCPNGVASNVVADTCLMPSTVTASADFVLAENYAANAVDGSLDTRWNSGKVTGKLRLDLSEPQALTSLVVYVTGQAGSVGATTTITMTATLQTEDGGPSIVKKATYDYGMMATGPIRVEFGLVNAKTLELAFASPSSWISVNEVLFVLCT